jgi:hypothetical protein
MKTLTAAAVLSAMLAPMVAKAVTPHFGIYITEQNMLDGSIKSQQMMLDAHSGNAAGEYPERADFTLLEVRPNGMANCVAASYSWYALPLRMSTHGDVAGGVQSAAFFDIVGPCQHARTNFVTLVTDRGTINVNVTSRK